MPRKLPTIHESQEELLSLFNTIQDRERRNRVHALFLAKMEQCRTRKEIARTLHVERKSVERWFKQYEQEGLQALLTSHRSHCGTKPRIAGDALVHLQEQLNTPEGFQGYESICTWLHERFGLDLPYKTVYHNVHYTLKGSPKVPRKSNVKKDPEREKRSLKKTFQHELNNAQQANTQQLPVNVFAQDESRFGLMTIIRRIITGQGVKPIVPFQQKYQTLYLYGVVEPLTGDQFFFSFSHLDSVCFQAFIDQVSEAFPETFNIVLLDRGTFHRAKELEIPQNMSFIFQPAATPEVNPIERVWPYIKDRLALKNFASLDDLFNAVSGILKDITHETFQSLTGFEYFITAVNGAFI